MILVLDSEAVWALCDRRTTRRDNVNAAMAEAASRHIDVVVPAVVLAELYRTTAKSAAVDSLLSRAPIVRVAETDRALARRVGRVLSHARLGSEFIVDAHLVALGVERGAALILTGDSKDITKLAAPYPNILVQQI